MKSRYPFPDLNSLPEDIRQRIAEVQQKSGFIPNVFLAFARRPAEWRAFFAYHDALMLKEDGSLSKGEREMIVTATSAANQCLYCVVAHGAILRIYEKKPLIADQVAVNYRKADISPRERAMLDFAMKVCLHSAEIDDADYEALYPHGFDDEDIWDIAAITAFFGLSNRMASFAGMQPNPEFYLMGRVPREKKPEATSSNSLAAIDAACIGMTHHPSQSSGQPGKTLFAGGHPDAQYRLLPRRPARHALRHCSSCHLVGAQARWRQPTGIHRHFRANAGHRRVQRLPGSL
jgi:uncharacterized peroxidase-related enzyme